MCQFYTLVTVYLETTRGKHCSDPFRTLNEAACRNSSDRWRVDLYYEIIYALCTITMFIIYCNKSMMNTITSYM